MKVSSINELAAPVIAYTIVCAFIALVLYCAIHGIPDNPAVNQLVGVLGGGGFVVVVSLYFGSSKSSRDKDSTINELAQNGNGAPKP
jgi:hypothetical protein